LAKRRNTREARTRVFCDKNITRTLGDKDMGLTKAAFSKKKNLLLKSSLYETRGRHERNTHTKKNSLETRLLLENNGTDSAFCRGVQKFESSRQPRRVFEKKRANT